ncbi:MAG: DegQ family serine endoprotease [Alphaproteobacteria bacterium]|nr:DegQ family serine endoprotease [Alphaproteobacteria bacterium]
MRLKSPVLLMSVLLLWAALSPGVQAQSKNPFSLGPSGSFADLAEALLPAVVNIASTQKMEEMPENMPMPPQFPPGSPFEDFFDQFMDRHGHGGAPAVPPASLGSGFIIDAEKGYIVTNNHVVRDAEEVRVTFQDDDTVVAEVVGRDEKTDLAVLKVKTDKKLTALRFGDSDVLRVGDWVLAIGNPFGLGGTVTAGIVSARQRDIQSGPYDDFIQTDASINRGNSGGPMFNLVGEVIGINTAIFSPSGGSVGIGFAIPSALARPVVDQILKYGHTRRGWLGVRIQSVTPEIADSLSLEHSTGALVASLTPGGPAEKAGLKAGDVILEFNGQEISAMRNLPRLVAETEINSEAEILYWRAGKKDTTQVKVGELEKAEEEGVFEEGEPEPGPVVAGVEVPLVGLTLKALSDPVRREFGIQKEVNGVLVGGVKDLSEAAQKGLLEGDVIVEINQKPVTDPKEAARSFEGAAQEGRSSVLLLLNRAGDVRFVALKLEKVVEQKSNDEPEEE